MSIKEIDITKVNLRKLIRTVRGSIKKAIFYLCSDIPYSFSEDLVCLTPEKLKSYLSSRGKGIKDIIEIDARVRHYDDIIDNYLVRINPKPVGKIRNLIKEFREKFPDAKEVAELFSLEQEILDKSFNIKVLKKKILRLIEIRPSDFFILVKIIVKKFGTKLTRDDYKKAWEFYIEFQRLRDLLDDIMSIEEDIIKSDYNSVVVAKENGIPYNFFEDIILNKLKRLRLLSNGLVKHPNRDTLRDTVYFWEREYELLFKKLLIDYYINLDEFRKSYFMIKQL